ncbi:YbaB/EbfC family nucleoid-associated protein [Paractinoplanes abujensis]|uniref:DNA-binding protein YbaB n=1 Tax=Paractinoplanes abujensis TaxID=882441 RepID=A0A7W7CNJ3_9ACTN|nr:YbaB/EbfC family nucleoid-associated protein [Actinoplanes abujensis]MBB4690066.1 DNA-binding protein YbaB [Actinoplanes abujensis]
MSDDAEGWVRSWSASVSEQAAATQSMADQVSRLESTASDRERLVRVTVDGSGCVTGLELEPEARRYDMDRLAKEILRTMRQAQARLTEQVAAIAERTVGVDTPTGRAVVSGFESRFPVRNEDDDGR